MPITSESFKLNGTDINPADELTTPGSIKYTATLASADGTSRPIDLGLDLPADLFASSAVLNITNISTPRQISIPIKVDFTYASGPMAFFRARFIDITNSTSTNIPIPPGPNTFNYIPTIASARCKFEIEAFDPSTPTRIYANISSAEFAVVAGPPPPPPPGTAKITFPFVNDFTISENRPTIPFSYSGPAVNEFRVEFLNQDVPSPAYVLVATLPSSATSFSFTAPSTTSTRCFFRIIAISSSGSLLTQQLSNQFKITSGPSPPPGTAKITFPFVNDFTISENRPTIPFSYSGPAVNEFRVEFLNQDVPSPAYVLVATLPSSATSFSFTAPSTTSTRCFFRIIAISSSGSLLTQQLSNQFKITSGPSPSSAITIDPIPTPVSLGTILNVRFRYTGPSVVSFKVGISNKGQTTASPIYSQTISSNPTNIYTLPFNIGNNPALVSTNCFVFVTTVMPGGSPILEYSNQFELAAASPPSVPELEILSPVPGSSLASKSKQIIKWRIKNFPPGKDYHIFVAESPNLNTSINGKRTDQETDLFSSPWSIKEVTTITPITLRFHIPEFGIDKDFDYTILPSGSPTLTLAPVADMKQSEKQEINFSFGGTASRFRIEFSSDNGTTYSVLPTMINSSSRKFLFKAITISDDCRLRLLALNASNNIIASAVSNKFKINASTSSISINLINPVPGSTLNSDSDHEIKWQINNFPGGNYTIYGAQSPDLNTNILGKNSNVNIDSFGKLWKLPRVITNTPIKLRLKILKFGIDETFDFTVIPSSTPPPAAGIVIDNIPDLVVGTPHNVKFTYSGSAASFRVYLFAKDHSAMQTFNLNGSFRNFNLTPAAPSGDCFIGIQAYDSSGNQILLAHGVSNKFNITSGSSPPNKITFDTIGDLELNQNYTIKFNYSGIASYFTAAFTFDGGKTINPLRISINGNDRSFNFLATPESDNCKLGIKAFDSTNKEIARGISNTFRIIKKTNPPPTFEDFRIIHFKDPINDSKQLIPGKLVPEVRSFYSFIAKLYSSIKGSNNPFESANLGLRNNLQSFLLALQKFPITPPLPTAPELNQIIDLINQNLENFVLLIAHSGLTLSRRQEYLMFVKQSVIRINKIIAAINGEGPEPSEPGVPLFDLYIGGTLYNASNPLASAFDLSKNNEASFFIKNKSKSKILNWNGIITPYPFNGVPVFKLEIISDKLNGEEGRTYKISIDRNLLNQLIQTKPGIKPKLNPSLQLFFRGGNFTHNPFSLRSLFSREKTIYILIPIRFQ